MLRSLLCSIKDMADRELMEVGECPYDQVRQEGGARGGSAPTTR